MRTLEEALNYFAYHPATVDTAPRHAAIRDLFAEVVERIWPLIPDGPDKTLVIRALWKAGTLANLAVALTAPADVSETRSVARQLPVVGNPDDHRDSEGRPPGDPAYCGEGCIHANICEDNCCQDAPTGVDCT